MSKSAGNTRQQTKLQTAIDKIAWHARNVRQSNDRKAAERSAIQIEQLCLTATLLVMDLQQPLFDELDVPDVRQRSAS